MTQSAQKLSFSVRPAIPSDCGNILEIIAHYAEKRLLLPRTEEDVLKRIMNFRIAETSGGKFLGCGAMRNYGNDLYEVRSLAVPEEFHGMGVASAIVQNEIDALKTIPGVESRLFSLTRSPGFFQRLGFEIVDKSQFPEKIWSDCLLCPNKDECDETAVLLKVG